MLECYLVVGTTGEYSDRTDWYVCVCPSQEKADAVANKLRDMMVQKSRELLAEEQKQDWAREDEEETFMARHRIALWEQGRPYRDDPLIEWMQKNHDPQFQHYYTGTQYSVVPVEFRL